MFLTRKMFINKMNAVLTMIKLSKSFDCYIEYRLDKQQNSYTKSKITHEIRDHKYTDVNYDLLLHLTDKEENFGIIIRDSFDTDKNKVRCIKLNVSSKAGYIVNDGMIKILNDHFNMKAFSSEEFSINYQFRHIELESSYYKIYKCFVALVKEIDVSGGVNK